MGHILYFSFLSLLEAKTVLPNFTTVKGYSLELSLGGASKYYSKG
jgi:hypothetical protein